MHIPHVHNNLKLLFIHYLHNSWPQCKGICNDNRTIVNNIWIQYHQPCQIPMHHKSTNLPRPSTRRTGAMKPSMSVMHRHQTLCKAHSIAKEGSFETIKCNTFDHPNMGASANTTECGEFLWRKKVRVWLEGVQDKPVQLEGVCWNIKPYANLWSISQ